MELIKEKWTKKDYQEFVKYLKTLQDIKYMKFSRKLTYSKYQIIGIKLPNLREIAKEILKGNFRSYLEVSQNNYLEETFIEGILISKLPKEEFLNVIDNFILKIDDWSICDTFCSNLKFIKKDLDFYFNYFKKYLNTNKEFSIRTTLIIYKCYYIKDKYIDEIIKLITNITSNDYYVLMGISWLLQEIYLHYPKKVIKILQEKKLNKFIINKTISKICDSYRVTKEDKELIKKYRI